MSDEENKSNADDIEAADYRAIMTTPAPYIGRVVVQANPDMIRAAFGEKVGDNDTAVHAAVTMSLQTAEELSEMLVQAVKAARQQREQGSE